MVSRIEALVDALASLHSWGNPESRAYQLRNPILVKNFSRPGKNEIDENGYRVFGSAEAGYRASRFDCELKCRGTSRAGIKEGDKLENLLRVYGITESLGQTQVVRFIRRALKDDSISKTTPLAFFRGEDLNVNPK